LPASFFKGEGVQRYTRFVIRRRFAVLSALAAIRALSAFSMSGGVMSSSMRDFPGESSRYQDYLDVFMEAEAGG